LEADRESDALRTTDHSGVDADHLAGRGHQRATGVARIERRVCLDHVIDQAAGRSAHRTAERRDDAGRHSPFEAERIADGDGDLATAQTLRIAQRRNIGKVPIGTHEGDIGIGIAAEHAATCGCAVGHRDPNSLHIADDMGIGDDQAIRRNDEAGSLSGGAAVGNALHPADGGAYPVDGVGDGGGIVVEQAGIVRLQF
jgi:hypothetical protein